MQDPFIVLGLDASTCNSPEEVCSAFRRLALRVHPDKVPSGDVSEFDKISLAKDRALQILAEREDGKSWGGGGLTIDTILSMMRSRTAAPGPVDWAVYVANRLVNCTKARTLQMDIDVTLEDIYSGHSKRLGISVLRAACIKRSQQQQPYRRVRQELIVPLSGDVMEHRFEGAGDDAPASLMGIGMEPHEKARRRGDVVVRVRPSPHGVFTIDQVISPLDLHTTVHVNLAQHYLGGTFQIQHLSGEMIEVDYQPSAAGSDGGDGQYRQVKVLRGYGLPDSTQSRRGDLYVFLVLVLPKLTPDDTRDNGIRSALELLTSGAGSSIGGVAATVETTPQILDNP